jgi:hypothetical protein
MRAVCLGPLGVLAGFVGSFEQPLKRIGAGHVRRS